MEDNMAKFKPVHEPVDNKVFIDKEAETVQEPEVKETEVDDTVNKGTEETPTDSQTEETSEQNEKVEEKVDELAILQKQVEELNAKNEHMREGMQKRIDQLTYELKSHQEKIDSNKEKSWNDLSVDELKKYRAHYREEGNDAMIDYLEDLIVDKKLESRLTTDKQVNLSNQTRIESWNIVTNEYEDLKNPNSEHYKMTQEIVASDPRFNDINTFPEGHAVAARLAAEKLLRQKVVASSQDAEKLAVRAKQDKQKNSLSVPSLQAPESSSNKAKLLEEAVSSGNPHSAAWKKYFKAIRQK